MLKLWGGWQTNAGLATGFGSAQLAQDVDDYFAVKANKHNANITFTGHLQERLSTRPLFYALHS